MTMLALIGLSFVLPYPAISKDMPPATEKNASNDAQIITKKGADGISGAANMKVLKKAIARNLRCPNDQPWTDEIVAKSIKVPVERLKALKSARSMTNDQVCTFPEPMLQRAWKKLETGKAGYPDEWAEFHNLRRRSDDGTVKADGLIKGHEHRKAVLKKIAEIKAAKSGAAIAPELTAAGSTETDLASIDIPSSGVDIKLAGIASDQWTEIGPGNIGGRIRAILIDPDNTNNIWVGGVSGGMYHSIDHGASFTPINDFMANLAISCIIMDPSNHNTLYAGTGEGFFNSDGVRGYGVFKSIDRGVTWNQLAATTPNPSISIDAYDWYYVNRLVISNNGATILAATRGYYSNYGGIWRSTNGGSNWTKVYKPGARFWDVRFDPNDPLKAIANAIYYNFSSSQYESWIVTSADGGLTWTPQNKILNSQARIELAYAKSNSQIIYASVNQNSGEIWKSTDGGGTWNKMTATVIALPSNYTLQHLGSQGGYDNTIWVDPTDSSHVVTAGIDAYRTTDGGTNWTKISNWGNNQIDVRYNGGTSHTPHADHHILISDPSYNGTTNRVLYNGNDGGLYRAPDITMAGETSGWDELNNGIALTQFYSVAGYSSSGTRIIGGAQDNGMLYNAGPGTNWKMFQGGDGGYSAVDATNDNYFYGEYIYLQISRVTDRGTSGNSTYIDKTGSFQLTDARSDANYNTGAPKANFIAPFILDPNDQNLLLAGGLSLWKNIAIRTGTSWTAIKPSTGSKISAIAVAEGYSSIVWVGHNDGSIYRTANGTDASPSWTQVSSGTIGTAQGRMVNRIVIDRDDPTRVYVSFGGYNNNNLWLTSNNGATWTDLNSPARVLPSVPIFGLARHPLNANWLYAGTEVGLFTSQDSGTTWSTSNDGPANVEIADLAWRDNTTLIAATHGRGMFLATAKVNTSTTVASNLTPSTYGQSITFTATVSPVGATGSVTFMDGASTLGTGNLSGNSATYSSASLGAGSHSITAVYTGDSSYNGSTSSVLTQTVNPAPLTVTADVKSKVYGNVDPTLTFSTAGFVNGDSAAIMGGALGRVAGETVNSYAIQKGSLTAGANYTISYSGANLTILPALIRLVSSGHSDVFYATLNDALLAPTTGPVSYQLRSGDITVNTGTTIATGSNLKLRGGYDSELTQQSTATPTILHGKLQIKNDKVIVENLKIMP